MVMSKSEVKWACCPTKPSLTESQIASAVKCPVCQAPHHSSCAKTIQRSVSGAFATCCGETPAGKYHTSTKRTRKGKRKCASASDPSVQVTSESDSDTEISAPAKASRSDTSQCLSVLPVDTVSPSCSVMDKLPSVGDPAPEKIESLDQLYAKILRMNESTAASTSQQIASLDEKVSNLSTTVSEKFGVQDGRIAELESKVAALHEQGLKDPLVVKFEAIAELNEQRYRECNILIHKVPDNGPANDRALLVDLLKESQILLSDRHAIRRIGKPDVGKTRPILVRFDSPGDARKFFGLRGTHREYDFSRDRTEDERRLIKKLGAEVDAHNLAHPDDKRVLKWKNGVPQIVPLSSIKQRNE